MSPDRRAVAAVAASGSVPARDSRLHNRPSAGRATTVSLKCAVFGEPAEAFGLLLRRALHRAAEERRRDLHRERLRRERPVERHLGGVVAERQQQEVEVELGCLPGPVQGEAVRAQIEVSRLDAEQRALAAEIRSAEVMLNTSLARDPSAAVPVLDASVIDVVPPAPESVARAAQRRPELRAGRAEIEQAEAEVRVMKSMYLPMAMVQTGPAYTMEEGNGWMFMVGFSVPLWRGKLRAGVNEANAMADMARADLDAMQRMAEGQARSARESVAAARERYVALRDDIVPRAEQAIEPTLAAYSSGQVPLVSVVEAAQALWSAQRDLVMARAELGAAWARLRRASTQEITP